MSDEGALRREVALVCVRLYERGLIAGQDGNVSVRLDRDRIEIKSGLRAGEKYVAVNAFIFKAEIGKGEAEHHH